MASTKKGTEEKAPRLSQIERLERELAAAKEKADAKVAKAKDADVLVYARAAVAWSKANEKLSAAGRVLVEKHGMTTEDIDALDVAAIVAAAPKPKAKAEAEPAE